MTSKEALEHLTSKVFTGGNSILETEANVCEEIILKDLERLETLENIFSDSHICEIKARFNEIECSTEKCNNCPLGFESGVCLKNAFETKWKLQQENEKLKKVIEILKSCLDFYVGEGIGFVDCVFENPIITFDLNNKKELEQYELLKEVLGN